MFTAQPRRKDEGADVKSFFLVLLSDVFSSYIIQGNIRAFVAGLLFSMLYNLCLTEVGQSFDSLLLPLCQHNLEGEMLGNKFSITQCKKISEVMGKDGSHLRCLDSKVTFRILESRPFSLSPEPHTQGVKKTALPC